MIAGRSSFLKIMIPNAMTITTPVVEDTAPTINWVEFDRTWISDVKKQAVRFLVDDSELSQESQILESLAVLY